MEIKTLTRYATFLSTVLRHCTVTCTVLLASRYVPGTQRRFGTFNSFAISVSQWCVNSVGSYRRITAVLAGAVQKLVAMCHIKLSQHLCGDPEETRDNLSCHIKLSQHLMWRSWRNPWQPEMSHKAIPALMWRSWRNPWQPELSHKAIAALCGDPEETRDNLNCHIKLSQHLCGDPEETRDNLNCHIKLSQHLCGDPEEARDNLNCHIKLSQHLCGDPEETRDKLSHGSSVGQKFKHAPTVCWQHWPLLRRATEVKNKEDSR